MKIRTSLGASVVLLVAACATDSGSTPTPASNVRLVGTSGDGQTAAPGVVLDSQLVVRVVDSLGNPLSGKVVSWAASGDGLVWPGTGTTDASGVTRAHWLLAATPGTQSVTATSGSAHASFAASAAGSTSFTLAQGVGPDTTCPGVVRNYQIFLQNASAQPVANDSVWWGVLAGAGSFHGTLTMGTVTFSNGASFGAYLTAGAPESASLIAWHRGALPYRLNVKSVSPCPVHAYPLGGDQLGLAGAQLLRAVSINTFTDSGTTPTGVVTWTTASGSGQVSAASTPLVAGSATVQWTLGTTPGAQTLQAALTGVPGVITIRATALDPTLAPTLVATVAATGATYDHDTYVRDGIAFSFDWNRGVLIYDVGNGMRGGSPGDPQLVSQLITSDDGVPGGPAAHNGWWFQNPVTGEKRYLFVGQEGPLTVGAASSGDIHIVDVSDLANPHEVGFIHVAGAGTHNFWMDEANQVLYAAYYNGGVIKVDVSGTLIGDMSSRIVAHVTPGGPGHTYVWGVMLSNGTLYASDFLSGFWALDPTTLATKGGGNNLPAHGPGSDLWVSGGYAYTGNWGNNEGGAWANIWTLDANGIPSLANSIEVPGSANTLSDVAVSPNGKMLVATVEGGTGNGLYIWDRVDPIHPQLRGRYLVPEGLHTGEVKEVNGRTYVFAARDPSAQALMIFDITDVVH